MWEGCLGGNFRALVGDLRWKVVGKGNLRDIESNTNRDL